MRHKIKIGRNDYCWCGSGKKYKKCHLGSDQAGHSAPTPSAMRHHEDEDPAKLILSTRERERMAAAGKFNAQLLDEVRDLVVPGARLVDIDDFVYKYTTDHGHVAAPLNYKGFPKSCCTSVNEVVCHGIPNDYALVEGDIVNVDVTTIVKGWHGDQSETFLVGEVSDEARRLVQVAFDCLHKGIEAIRPYGKVRDIGEAITEHAHAENFSVVRAFQGHGIGRVFHQEPGIPHFPDHHQGDFVIEPGMCFTIEPMINEGKYGCTIDKRDGWTARTVDGKLSAQFEHTILMTNEGPQILTTTERGPRPGHKY
jgi:methionyl aminopeptidase